MKKAMSGPKAKQGALGGPKKAETGPAKLPGSPSNLSGSASRPSHRSREKQLPLQSRYLKKSESEKPGAFAIDAPALGDDDDSLFIDAGLQVLGLDGAPELVSEGRVKPSRFVTSGSEDRKGTNSETREGSDGRVTPCPADLEDSTEEDNLHKLFGFEAVPGGTDGEVGCATSQVHVPTHADKFKPPFFDPGRRGLQPGALNLNYFSGPLPKANCVSATAPERGLRKTAEPFRPKVAPVPAEQGSAAPVPDLPDRRPERSFEIFPPHIIEDGRTTLYIRNIPNKYTKEQMLSTLDEEFQGTYDFFYLPIDFMSGSNVGYAFINFVDLRVIPKFYQSFQDRKWTLYNSGKICDLRYARIQGKEKCENHFLHSLLMRQPIQNYKPYLRSDAGLRGQPPSTNPGPGELN